jgi:hypothetical protein
MTYTKPELREVGLAENVVLFDGVVSIDNPLTEERETP